jgi:hypothetical protein
MVALGSKPSMRMKKRSRWLPFDLKGEAGGFERWQPDPWRAGTTKSPSEPGNIAYGRRKRGLRSDARVERQRAND